MQLPQQSMLGRLELKIKAFLQKYINDTSQGKEKKAPSEIYQKHMVKPKLPFGLSGEHCIRGTAILSYFLRTYDHVHGSALHGRSTLDCAIVFEILHKALQCRTQ